MTYLGFEKLLHVWVFQKVPSVFLLAWKPRSICWVKAAGLQLSGPAGGEALVSVTLCSPSLQILPTSITFYPQTIWEQCDPLLKLRTCIVSWPIMFIAYKSQQKSLHAWCPEGRKFPWLGFEASPSEQ